MNGLDQELVRAQEHLIRAYESVYDGYSLDRVLADPELASALSKKCHELGLPGTPKDWNHHLMRHRKAGKLVDSQRENERSSLGRIMTSSCSPVKSPGAR